MNFEIYSERDRLLPSTSTVENDYNDEGNPSRSHRRHKGSRMPDEKYGSGIGISRQTLVSEGGGYGQSRRLPQYVAALAVTLGALGTGTVLAWTSPASSKYDDAYDFKISEDQKGWIGGLVTLGAAFICAPIGILMERFGRKFVMLTLIIPFTIGWCLIIWADSILMLYFGRFITGIAGGAFCVSAPLYTSEIAEKEIRGALGSYFQLLLTVGILLMYTLSTFCTLTVISIVSGIIPLIFGVAFAFQPETPVYQVRCGNTEGAKKALLRLRGSNYDIDSELREMIVAEEDRNQSTVAFKEVFKRKATKKGIFIGINLMVFQQLSGVNAIIFYAENIVKDIDIGIQPSTCTVIIGIMQVIATFIASIIIEKLGRRILLLTSDFVMSLCTISLGVYFYLKETWSAEDIASLDWLPLLSLSVFIIAFSIGFGPIPWMMIGEISPPEIRTQLNSVACTLNWILAFLVTKFFDNLKHSLKDYGTFWLFAVISAIGTVFVFFLVPETKGKTLNEIQRELEGLPAHRPAGQPRDNEGFSKN